jgi:hypothetical protein
MPNDSNRVKIEAVNEPESFSPDQRNPLTKLKHRREVLWQITVPLVIFILIFLAMGVLAAAGTASQASQLADISLIWLISPTFIFGLITLVVLVALIYGIIRLIVVLPFYSFRLYTMLKIYGARLQGLGDKAVEPVLRVQAFGASMRTFGRNMRGAVRRTPKEMQE